MPLEDLSDSAQDYLKVVWGLQEWTDAPVTASSIAEKAGVRTSTVSGAISKLADQGLVEHARYGAVTLTDAGRRYALAMVRRHRLIETFLVQMLGYRWDEVHDEAERLEHAVSDDLVMRIDVRLGHPTRDPHGDPIPQPDGSLDQPSARLLSEMTGGGDVVVERISDDDPALLKFFADRGVLVGARLKVHEGSPYSEAMEIGVADRDGTFSLGGTAAAAVHVSEDEG
ncbi:metal-dependent transcriptional regulator [Dermacoccaceae bacterium W4C1]